MSCWSQGREWFERVILVIEWLDGVAQENGWSISGASESLGLLSG